MPSIAHAAAALLTFAYAAVAQAQGLPDGPGKAVVQTACAQCHGVDVIVAQRHSRDEWTEVVSRMVGNGAQLSDENFKAAVDYLATHLGPLGQAPISPAPSPAAGGK